MRTLSSMDGVGGDSGGALSGSALNLTRVEERLLECLERAGKSGATSQVLREYAWPNARVMRHTLHVHISALRRKLATTDWTIGNIRGWGYALIATKTGRESDSRALES